MKIPLSGLCDMKLLLVENRSHVWMDLSRLVDSACKIIVCSLTQAFSGRNYCLKLDSVT